MKKYKCKKCGNCFYGMDEHFEYDENVCEECGTSNSYQEVDEKDYTIHDYGVMLDNELENANHHSFCGLGETIEDVISANVVNTALAKKLMKLLGERIYEMI